MSAATNPLVSPLPNLLARLSTLPGFSAHQLPQPTEPLLDTLIAAFGAAEAYSLWLGVLYAQIYAAPGLTTAAEELAALIGRAGKLLEARRTTEVAAAFEARLPDWKRALEALLAALSAPALTLPPASQEAERNRFPLAEVVNALLGLYLDACMVLYHFRPDNGRAVADYFADRLPAVLAREGLGWNNKAQFVLEHATKPHRRLAALLDKALGGPYPTSSRWEVLYWTADLLHKHKPTGLKTLARELTRFVPSWTDEAFDQLIREVVLREEYQGSDETGEAVYQPVPALRFRRQPDRRAVLEALVAQGRTTPEARRLAAFLAEVNAPESAPVTTLAAGTPLLELFPDPVLCLAVVQELMFDQTVLQPRFDVYAFAASFTGREIDVEQDGYDVIPEVLHYLTHLPATAEQLAQVESLSFEYGKPEFDIVSQVFPFDGGEGEELQLTSLAGLAHCPNLEQFYLTELWPDYTAPDLTPLLALPHLREAHLDPTLAADPVYQELARRGVLR